MHGIRCELWRGKQSRTFFASWVKVEYVWMAFWIVSASFTFRSVSRTMFGILMECAGVDLMFVKSMDMLLKSVDDMCSNFVRRCEVVYVVLSGCPDRVRRAIASQH
jgi:hypothetical protein